METSDVHKTPQVVVFPSEKLVLSGEWTLSYLEPIIDEIRTQLKRYQTYHHWNLEQLTCLDGFGAVLITESWHGCWPDVLQISQANMKIVNFAFQNLQSNLSHHHKTTALDVVIKIGQYCLNSLGQIRGAVTLFGHLIICSFFLLKTSNHFPWKEISANIYKIGVKAMPIVALVGFLIGIVLSYLSAYQLQNFGASFLLVDILGIGIIRELGPVLVSILVAGRSGSSMTAQIGLMRVTQEIDALESMGVSTIQRLVFPKLVAMVITMPFLVLWSNVSALLGGMVAAKLQLGMGMHFFFDRLIHVVPIRHLYLSFTKGIVFGFLIALTACYLGLQVKSNSESLSENTTISVVLSITLVILADAFIALVCNSIGI